MKELMNWLNDKASPPTATAKFTYNSVQKLLTNKRYIGEKHFKDIVMPDSIPAIVDKDLFEEVQQKIAKNKKAPARHKAEDDYLLTTKLFCGMCGAMMFGECGTSRNKVKSTAIINVPLPKSTRAARKRPSVNSGWKIGRNQTMQLVKDDAAMESIIAKVMELQNKENTNIPLYEKQLRMLNLVSRICSMRFRPVS